MAYTSIDNPSEHFKAVTYTGNSTEPRNIDVGFQSDFVWVKDRTVAYYARIFDSNRVGAGPLYPSEDKVEDHHNDGPEIDFSSPYSNGFKIIDNPDGTTNSYGVNQNSSEIISWNWKANGGTTSSNTDGSITSTVQANTDGGFSIVQYTGTGTAATIGHGLGVAPAMYIVKNRDQTGTNWTVFHKDLTSNAYHLYLNNGAPQSNSVGYWNSTSPTSTVFSIKNTSGDVNTNTEDYVVYCFAEKQGYSKFGKYKGNGNANGAFVYTGFKPAFVMTKASSSTSSWMMYDHKRLGYNPIDVALRANGADAESTSLISGNDIDLYSNGFKLINSNATINGSGTTYIYMAFAENPFVTSGGVPTTAR